MKRISLFLTGIFICLFANGRVICDTTCHAPEDEFRNYAVISPVGRSMVKHIEQAPRLTTLDNKTNLGKLGTNAVSGSAVVIDQNCTIFKNLLSFI